MAHTPGRLEMLEKFIPPAGSSEPWWVGVGASAPKLRHSLFGAILKHVLSPLLGFGGKTEPEWPTE